MTISVLSEAMLRKGKASAAAQLAREALQVARTRRQRGLEAWVLKCLGDLASGEQPSRSTVAKKWYSEAAAAAEECGMRPLLAHCEMGLAKLLEAKGHQSQLEARGHFNAAVDMYRQMRMDFWLRRSCGAFEADGAQT
jgi:hypothetical protein